MKTLCHMYIYMTWATVKKVLKTYELENWLGIMTGVGRTRDICIGAAKTGKCEGAGFRGR